MSDRTPHAEARLLLLPTAWIGAIALALAAIQVVWLRLAGWALIDVSGFAHFFIAIALAGICAAIRACWLYGGRCRSLPTAEYAIALVPLLGGVVLAASLTSAATSPYVVFLFWFVFAAEEAITLLFFVPQIVPTRLIDSLGAAPAATDSAAPFVRDTSPQTAAEPRRGDSPSENASPLQASPPPAADEEEKLWRFDAAEGPAPHFVAGNVSQQLTRAKEATTEVVYGYLRADFAAGHRHQTLHVAFCPPLAGIPEVEICQVEGPEVSVKVAEVEAHGARVELRRSGPHDDSTTVLLELHAAAEGDLL
ncbi:MAG: hypothetical protein ACIALR_10230 [Blastopirellula sp. JB062]